MSATDAQSAKSIKPQFNFLVNPFFNLWFNGSSSVPAGWFTNNATISQVVGAQTDGLIGAFYATAAITAQYGGFGQSIPAIFNCLFASQTYVCTYRYKVTVTSSNLQMIAQEGDGSFTNYASKNLTSTQWVVDSFTFTVTAGQGHDNNHPVIIQATDMGASGWGTVEIDWIAITQQQLLPTSFPVTGWYVSDNPSTDESVAYLGDFYMLANKYLHFGGATMYFNSTYSNVAIQNSASGGGFQMQAASYLQLQRTSDFASLLSIYTPNQVALFDGLGNETNGTFRIYGWITRAAALKYAQWTINTTDQFLHLSRQDTTISGMQFDMPVNFNNTVSVSGILGASGTVSLAKLTTLGTNGSLTVINGIITAITNPT